LGAEGKIFPPLNRSIKKYAVYIKKHTFGVFFLQKIDYQYFEI